MKRLTKIASVAGVAVASFLPMAAAGATDTCQPPYCNPKPPTPSGGEDGGVLPSEQEKPAVTPASSSNGSSSEAPTGELPFTGGDVAGLAIIGAGALGLGAVMVRMSKRARATA